jgi:TIR domain
MNHVFVSYSRADSEWVLGLVRRLEASGCKLWLDQQDIPMTLPWFEQIEDAIIAADLFLICDSSASRESANCGAETRIAMDAGKRTLEVEVGENTEGAADAVKRALSQVGQGERLRTELAVLAQDWERGGRERGALVSRRRRRQLSHGIEKPPLTYTERAFVKASRRRTRRRAAVSTAIGLFVVLGILGDVLSNAVVKRSNEEKDRQAVIFTRARQQLANLWEDPYKGLSEAAALGQNESAVDAEVIAKALEPKVPDDAFTVPTGAVRFSGEEVRGEVAVVDADGKVWARSATAQGTREARPYLGNPMPDSRQPGPPLQLRRRKQGSVVDVFRNGLLWRHIVFSQQPTVLQLSPNGRELAAAGDGSVEIADLQLGTVRTTADGAVAPIRDLAWSADGSHLWAAGGRLVVSWRVRDGKVLVDDPGAEFEALLPAARPDAAWAVASGGDLRMFDTKTGKVLATRRIPDHVLSGAGAPGGTVAAISGDRGLWVVPLPAGKPHLMRIPECTLGRATFMSATQLYLPCLNGPLLRISAPRAKIEQRIRISALGAFSAKALPRHHAVMVGDSLAGLFLVPEHEQPREIFEAECGASITRIAISPSERVITPVGAGTGVSGCLRRGLLTGSDPGNPSDWIFDQVIDDSTSPLGEAAAISRSGKVFAYGFADGTVILHPTVNLLPEQKITNVVGMVRDMYVTKDDGLLVATTAGIVQRIPLCDSCLSNRAMASLAAAELKRGLKIGAAVRVSRKSENRAQRESYRSSRSDSNSP